MEWSDTRGSKNVRRVCGSENPNASLHSSGIMDFRWFNPTGAHGSSQTLVCAVRSGEVNLIDLRLAPGQNNAAFSPDAVASKEPVKYYRPQQRALSSTSNASNPPASLQLSNCGTRLTYFTELGGVEVWDTRFMRASFERIVRIDALQHASLAPLARQSSADAVPSSSPSAFEFRLPSQRVCSSSAHPQDDLCFLFQQLNGAVGMLDLNPHSPSYRLVTPIVPFDVDSAGGALGDEWSMRRRRSHVFLPHGSRAGVARREKIIAVANGKEQVQIWGAEQLRRRCVAGTACELGVTVTHLLFSRVIVFFNFQRAVIPPPAHLLALCPPPLLFLARRRRLPPQPPPSLLSRCSPPSPSLHSCLSLTWAPMSTPAALLRCRA